MSPRKASATSGISPTDDIPLEDYPKQKRTAEKYKDDGDDEDEDEEEESLKGSSPRSEDSRYTLYKEQIGYVSPRDHREMELYLARVQGSREVVGRIDHFIGPASKAKIVSLLEIEHSVDATCLTINRVPSSPLTGNRLRRTQS